MADKNPDFLETNLALLKKHHHSTWQMLVEAPPEPVGDIFFDNGKANLRLRNHGGNFTNLHFADAPEVEITQFLELIEKDATDVVAFFGMGLGYAPLAILQQRPFIRHVIVFEANSGIFIQALRCMDLSQLLTDSRSTIIVGEPHPDLETALSHTTLALELEKIQLLRHQNSISLDSEKYQILDRQFNDFATAHIMDAATKIGQGKTILKNHIINLQSIHRQNIFEEMLLLFQGVPAFLVAAGPSLDDNVHLLKKIKDKGIIICVDSALATLMHHGITPHFVTSLEHNEFNFEKLAPFARQSNDISLVCMPQINPQVPKCFPANKVFWLFTKSPLNTWINKMLGGTIFTGGTGTVAHLNIISAILLGCSPIVFVGQDLAYTSLRDHTEHALLGYPEDIEEVIANQDTLRVEGITGDMLPTRPDFYTYKKMFEQIIAGNPGNYINSSARGAHIKGTEVIPLDKVIDSYCQKHIDIKTTIGASISQVNNKPSLLLKGVEKTLQEIAGLKNLISRLSHLINTTEEKNSKLKSSASNYSTSSNLPDDIQKKISKIDRLSNMIDDAPLIWGLVEEITLAGMRELERMRHALTIHQQSSVNFPDWLSDKFKFIRHSNQNRMPALILLEQLLVKTVKFYKNENKHLKKIKLNGNIKENLTNLARLYIKSSNHNLLKPVLDKLRSMPPVSPETYFALGTVAAFEMRFSDTDKYFELAGKEDKTYENRVNKLRNDLAEKYLSLKKQCESGQAATDRKTARKILIRGYKYCNNHPGIIRELKTIFQEDIDEAKENFNRNFVKSRMITDNLDKDLKENPEIISCLHPSQLAEFYHLKGELFFTEKDYKLSIASINRALTYAPEAGDYFFLLSRAYFHISDFDNGIANLNKAIAQDVGYAGHWEIIGDMLYEAGDHSSAIYAYEQCFLHLPDRLDIIKKIGDCYYASGQLEAAQEAYNQVKAKVEALL